MPMELKLPPRTSRGAFDKALRAFEGIVGADWVLATDEDRETYGDVFSIDDTDHVPGGAVAPANVEEVRAVIKLANQYKIPVWPISRGKNFGYGGSAPLMSGSIVLDLSRMKKIIEVDEKLGYCVIEPGVGFYDLYQHLQENKIPLWMSVPGNSWGSVIGNALDRGVGYTPYGQHTSKLCGMEVVLPDGDLVRTGMGAMTNNPAWPLYPYGFGPAWDQMFVQSNFGIVTKAGLWLMPEPESTTTLAMQLPNRDDIGWAVEALCPLRMSGVIAHTPSLGSYIRSASIMTTRKEWYDGKGPMPESAVQAMLKKFNLGWWVCNISLFGYEKINKVNATIVRDAMTKLGKAHGSDFEIKTSIWRKGDPIERSGAGVPMVFPLQNINFVGGRGAHIGFSPILPPRADKALAQFHRTLKRYEEFGFDYHGSFALGERFITNVNQLLFDRDDPEMVKHTQELFKVLLADAAKEGYAEYRTHLSYMDDVAATFDFNNNALRRLNERVKDVLDPNGILAPGKSGVWPNDYKGVRS
jgi:4-cresol dehydrogenase (hydroxylating)